MNPVDELLLRGISDGIFPGACYAILSPFESRIGACGRFTYSEDSHPVTPETLWDLASVSKVVGTTTAVMRLVEEGRLDLQLPVATVVPEFGQSGKERVTFANLLVHDSGLVAFRRYHEFCASPAEIMSAIYAEELTYPTGTQTVYSDLSLIVMAEVVRRITGRPLDAYLADEVFGPLGMGRTGYNPADTARCAPTERNEPWRNEWGGRSGEFIQGEVHDPTAFALGGVAGHAGLFSTVEDLAAFMSALTTDRIVSRETWSRFTRRQDPKSSRALGWDTKSPEGSSAGSLFGPRSFGHTGYTGTSVWCDPDRNLVAVLLTNRVHPTSENTKIISFRPRFHDAVASSL